MYNDIENKIANIILKKEYISVADLAKTLNISQSTVRRNLDKLQNKKIVERTHGGVRTISQDNLGTTFVFRKHINAAQKKVNALKALKLIKNGDVIFLDGSTSAFFLVEYLNEFSDITVVTNGIEALAALSNCGVNAISTGGTVLKANNATLVGDFALNTIEKIHADIVFFSCAAISKNGTLSDYYAEEIAIRRKMIQNSTTSVLLCDSEKLNKTKPFFVANLCDIDYLVIDSDPKNLTDLKPKKEIIN